MDDAARYQRAHQRVQELRSFYIHLIVYLIVNTGLLIIDFVQDGEINWFYWALLGWGIGVAVHGFVTFAQGAWLGRDWEERKVRELMERDR
jgi:hypothetical protein